MKKLKMIIVNYYSIPDIQILLDSIDSTTLSKIDVSVCIVDNTLCENQKELLQSIVKKYVFIDIDLIFSKKNLGYFGAAHYAIRKEGFIGKYDFIALINPDIKFSNLDFLSEVQLDRNIGLLSINVVNQDLVPYNPFMKSSPKMTYLKLLRFISSYYFLYKTYELLHILKKKIKKIKTTKSQGFFKEDMYASHGSVFIFTQEAIRKGFDFAYPGFLFLEELFVAEQMADMGLKTVYIGQISAIHYEHQTTGKFKSKLMVGYLNQSINLFIKYLSKRG